MKFLLKIMAVMVLGVQLSIASDVGKIVKIKVNGMVCAFCSNSLDKKFKKRKEVKTVVVDLDTKLVTVTLEKGKKLSKKAISKIIKKSGFSVVSVDMGTAKNEK